MEIEHLGKQIRAHIQPLPNTIWTEKGIHSIHAFDRYKLYDFPYEADHVSLRIDVATLRFPSFERDEEHPNCVLCDINVQSPWIYRDKQYRYLYIVKPMVQGVDMGRYSRCGLPRYYYPLREDNIALQFRNSRAFANSRAQILMEPRRDEQLPAYSPEADYSEWLFDLVIGLGDSNHKINNTLLIFLLYDSTRWYDTIVNKFYWIIRSQVKSQTPKWNIYLSLYLRSLLSISITISKNLTKASSSNNTRKPNTSPQVTTSQNERQPNTPWWRSCRLGPTWPRI